MAKRIQLDTECSAICYVSARLISLGSEQANHICHHFGEICETCREECGKYQSEQECAQACKQRADECRKIAA
jgi:hypothetical protein